MKTYYVYLKKYYNGDSDLRGEFTNFEEAMKFVIRNADSWLKYLKKKYENLSVFNQVVIDEPDKFGIRVVTSGNGYTTTCGFFDVVTYEDGNWKHNSISKNIRESWLFEC